MLARVDMLSMSSLRWSSSSQQSVTRLRMFLQETSEKSFLIISTSSSLTISTSLTWQGGGGWLLGAIIMALLIIELSLLSLLTITGQLRPSVFRRSWNPRLLQSTNKHSAAFQNNNQTRKTKYQYKPDYKEICYWPTPYQSMKHSQTSSKTFWNM